MPKTAAAADTRYTDAEGHAHEACGCGHDCSAHPDAGFSLDYCADCDAATCPSCREYVHDAPICTGCLEGRARRGDL